MKKLLVVASVVLSINSMAKDKVIYGVDNRMELSRTPFAHLKNSVAGMVSIFGMQEDENGDFEVSQYGRMTSYRGIPTCKEMRFREQATLPTCSGFLIADDILVTAGHCLLRPNQKAENLTNFKCLSSNWVFGFDSSKEKDGKIKFSKNDVAKCSKIIAGSYTQELDFAIIKLDKKVPGKTPVKFVKKDYEYEKDEQVFVVGHPTGLPLKLAAGAKVTKIDETILTTDLDTFAGNSGSAVFNYYGEVVGVLVSGETDYTLDRENMCVKVNKCEGYQGKCDQSFDGKGSGEKVTKATLITKYLKDL